MVEPRPKVGGLCDLLYAGFWQFFSKILRDPGLPLSAFSNLERFGYDVGMFRSALIAIALTVATAVPASGRDLDKSWEAFNRGNYAAALRE